MAQSETTAARASIVPSDAEEAEGLALYLALREEARAAVRAAIERGGL